AINFSVLNLLIDEAQDLIISSNKNERYFLYGILGYLYRVTGKPKKAIEYLTFTLDYFEEKDDIKEVISLIRLGEAYKYDDQHHVALDKFNKALKICEVEQIDEYLDFALQHKGKCLMELTMLEEAVECFLTALDIRKTKENPSLIDSTQQAIDLIREIKRN